MLVHYQGPGTLQPPKTVEDRFSGGTRYVPHLVWHEKDQHMLVQQW